jgi:hypothetical protein
VSAGWKAIKDSNWGIHTDIIWRSFLVLGNATDKFPMLDMQHAQHKQEIHIKHLLQIIVGKFKLEDKEKTMDDNYKQTKKIELN